MNVKKSIVLICIFFTGIAGYSQSVAINAYLDTNTIWVGDQIYFTLEITREEQFDVELPVFSNTLGNDIEIIEQYETDTTLQNGKQLLQKKLLVTAFDSGMYFVPRLPVLVTADSRTDTLETSPTYLKVLPYYMAELEEEPADIKEIQKVPVIFREVLPYLLILAVLGLIAAGVYYWLKHRKKNILLQPAKPKEPAYVTAERELDELKKEKLWQQNETKEYYIRLTNIIRKYIENQFEIKALEQTTGEILKSVNAYGLFDRETRQILADMLPLADMVKFARGTADPDENVKHLENAYIFIRMTKEFITEKEEEEEPKTEEA